MNRPTLRAVLALACAALCGTLVAGCGDADDEPDTAAASTLTQTFDATSKLRSARLTASFVLVPEGLVALGGPIAFGLSGPLVAGADGELPRFDFAIAGSLARKDLRARVISTGKRVFLTVDGRDYKIDRRFVDGLLAGGDEQAPGIASLGLDPAAWFKDPRSNGTETLGREETQRISGSVDVGRLLADIANLIGGGDGILTPAFRKQIVTAVRSSTVDVWTGAEDKILRRLHAVVDVDFEDGMSPISGLEGGKLTLRARVDHVNETTVAPVAPKRARPLSELTGDGGLGALLSGLGAGMLNPMGGGDGGDAFLKCLGSSGGKTADIVQCASKLAP